MIENINIEGQNVSAELHALMYDYLYGYDGVFNYGKKLSYEVVSNNKLRINDGLIISQGRFTRIVTGSYEAIAIENGTSGVNRCDLIVAHFETDGIKELYDIRVIKGTDENEPSYTTGDTFNGATVHEMPLYAVHLEGLNIASVEQKFNLINSVDELSKTINEMQKELDDLLSTLEQTVLVEDTISVGSYDGYITFITGMTWKKFCNSKYNVYGFYLSDGSVCSKEGYYLFARVSSTMSEQVTQNSKVDKYNAYYYEI